LLPLCAAIANQCFSTGYAWSVTTMEQAELDKLTLTILESLGSGTMPSAFAVATLGSYGALHEFAHAEKFFDFGWPRGLASVVERQLKSPAEEKGIKREIRCVAPVRRGVSERVRAQYEDDPYPMWLEPPRPPVHRDPALWLEQNFPQAPAIELGKERPINILIAGCGTGNEPVGYSLALSGVAIKAFDLSLTSLAYAIRKTRALKLANIDYFQADLLELDDSIGSFDIVVAAGVLHHLERPAEGWGVLRDLTKPGGYIMTALYSERARRHVVEAQEFAKAGGYDTTRESLRRFRHDVDGLAEDAEWRADLLGREEFYTLGMLRDLVFHVQEQRFTPDGIMKCMSDLGLLFQGFLIRPATEQLFRIKFGAAADFLSLAQWEEFEADYPDTFSEMFHFLCRKPR
jgi:2-polyprenyl-3-methyl-5-hydroxy-6-metoxy-1,4-benzoquinol methylase